ncbi:hypothetical protein BKA64DRAFT_254172 [Cadophora sp. MPI-SDFR-AT-0126]|nr:hypothetical protein BKA64DRAFT_254172 [Leotiomycetes sp. MPI-SDFR-AT-0126]
MDPFDPFDSDFEGEDLEDEAHYQLDYNHNVLRRGRQPLGLARNYVPRWKPVHAIREFYQNWKDAIVETAGLQQHDFEPLVKGFEKDVYIVEARHPTTGKLLGFIRFKDGVLEFTNFGAQLSRRALEIGETSKWGNREAAGTHGEGFKVGSLVMVREGYRVQYEASKFRWTMKFGGRDQTMLYCFLSDLKDTTLQKHMDAYEKKVAKGKPRELKNNIWEDVTVRIGKIRGHGLKIEKEDFEKWIKVSIDLNRPSKMIHTAHGSLILDLNYGDKIFLKGLLLEGKSSGKPFKFGYNLRQGDVNRDRERLIDPAEEAKVLAEIWTEAIQLEEAIEKEWVAMLREDKYADVHGVEQYISKDAAAKIWQHLLKLDVSGECFYYESKNSDRDVEIIRRSLKKRPEQLISQVWDPLRKYGLVRTPREQQCYLLNQAPRTQSPPTAYSLGVERALKAALAMDSRTKELNLIFKSGIKTDLDLLLDGRDLQINDKWLDFENGHRRAPCWLSRQAGRECFDADHFSCDHIVRDLYELVLGELKRHGNVGSEKLSESNRSLHQRLCESFRQMPIMVESKAGTVSETIAVSWTDLDGDVLARLYGLDPKFRVTLHRESTCSSKRNDLILSEEVENEVGGRPNSPINDDYCICGCPTKVVSRKDSRVTFCGLNLDEAYFPMVSRNEFQAFFGLAPKSLKPERVQVAVGQPETMTSFATPQRTSARKRDTSVVKDDWDISDMGDLYGVSDDDEPPAAKMPAYSPLPPSDRNSGNEGRLSARLSRRPLTPLAPLFDSSRPKSASYAAVETEQFRGEDQSFEANIEEKEHLIVALKADIKILSSQLTERELELESLNLKLQSQREAALASQEQQNNSMEEEISQHQLQLEAKNQLLRHTQESLQASEQKRIELEKYLAEILETRHSLKEQLDDKTEELLQANSENENWAGQLEAATVECLAQIRRIDEDTAKIKKLNQNLQTANEDLQLRRKEIEDLNAKVASLQRGELVGGEPLDTRASEIQRLQTANDQLRAQRRSLKDSISDLERRLREAEEAYDTQLRLAAETARRRDRRLSSIRSKSERGDSIAPITPKRERDDNDDDEFGPPTPTSRGSKRARVNVRDEDAIDLTDE